LVKEDGEIEVATIKTSMVCFDYKERKVRSIPDELRKILVQCTEQKNDG
jgi:acyl-CoA thioesterase FadM